MQLLKAILFVCLIYGTSARDLFPDLSPYVRQIIEAGRGHINKRCVGIVEGQGGNMRTGWGGIVDPIDPLRFDRLELPLGSTNLTLLNAEMNGISRFNMNNCDLKILGLYGNITLHFPELVIVGKHETKAKIGLINYQGSGDITIILTRVTVTVVILISPIGPDPKYLNLEHFEFDIHVEKTETHMDGFGLPAVDKLVSSAVDTLLKPIMNAGDIFWEYLFVAPVYAFNVTVLNQISLPEVIARVIAYLQSI